MIGVAKLLYHFNFWLTVRNIVNVEFMHHGAVPPDHNRLEAGPQVAGSSGGEVEAKVARLEIVAETNMKTYTCPLYVWHASELFNRTLCV